MKDEPFTKDEVDSFNRYTHFPVDINKEFSETVKAKEEEIRNELAHYGIKEMSEKLKTAIYYYRKAIYNGYLDRAKARSIAPPVSVVGPSKYSGNVQRAMKIEEKIRKRIETAEKYIRKAIVEAIKYKLPLEKIEKWLPLAKKAKSKIAFGKLYATKVKDDIEKKEEKTRHDEDVLRGTWDHVLRSEGRAFYVKFEGMGLLKES